MATVQGDMLAPLLQEFVADAGAEQDAASPEQVEKTLKLGLALSLMIDWSDARWREAMAGGRPYDEADYARIEGMYRDWIEGAGTVLRRVEAIEAAGHPVRWGDRFREALAENRGAVMTPEEFFADPGPLEAIRRRAAEQIARGAVEDFDEMGE